MVFNVANGAGGRTLERSTILGLQILGGDSVRPASPQQHTLYLPFARAAELKNVWIGLETPMAEEDMVWISLAAANRPDTVVPITCGAIEGYFPIRINSVYKYTAADGWVLKNAFLFDTGEGLWKSLT